MIVKSIFYVNLLHEQSLDGFGLILNEQSHFLVTLCIALPIYFYLLSLLQPNINLLVLLLFLCSLSNCSMATLTLCLIPTAQTTLLQFFVYYIFI